MIIGVPESARSIPSLTAAKKQLELAISSLNNQCKLFSDVSDADNNASCKSIKELLQNEYDRLCSVENEILSSQQYLKSVDNGSATPSDRETIITGATAGAGATIAGHFVSTNTISAFITKGYRGGARQIHGFAHEVIFSQTQSWKLSNLFKTAIVDGSNKTGSDVIVKGLKTETWELKATKSTQYMKNAAKSSKYAGSKVAGTSEIAAETGCTSSGVKYSTTLKVGAEAQAKSGFSLALKSLGKSAASGGIAGAVIGGGIEAASKYSAWKNGEITGKEYAKGIAKEAAIEGVAGATGAAVATGVALAVGGTVALPAVAVVGIGVVVGGAVSWGLHKLFG